MPRRNKKERRVYRVRTKVEGQGFRSSLVNAGSALRAASMIEAGRILSVNKVGMEELLRVGSYFRLGDSLMKEFQKKSKQEGTNGTSSRGKYSGEKGLREEKDKRSQESRESEEEVRSGNSS